ncbi:uncharacterized protein N7477_001945 [Penicillium maclennaniae]|uniref:uncharacterized protein n=1 Tax=Penicillium maclennaniae TaxID=1343394 RepID=UPI00254168CD|nr:uncharacterized protein N7477_001945 [Penicillium maclennaniae]KAJ5682005.1 hypothetical protein N7477_001945 [Penicillium maclennaniae]
MTGTHCTIDAVAKLQKGHPEKLAVLSGIASTTIDISEAAFKHGEWKAELMLFALGAQISRAHVAAVQLVDDDALPQEFHYNLLDRNILWALVDKTEWFQTPELGGKYEQRTTIAFEDGEVMDDRQRDEIERLALDIENVSASQGILAG